MCDFVVSRAELLRDFDVTPARLETLFQRAAAEFGDMVQVTDEGFVIPDRARPLTRMIARAFDAYDSDEGAAFLGGLKRVESEFAKTPCEDL